MKKERYKDLGAGTLFLTIAVIFAHLSRELTLGTIDKMGPGYFPIMVSFLLMIIGVLLIVKSFLWKY